MDLDLRSSHAAILGCSVIRTSKLTAEGLQSVEAKTLDFLAVYGAGSAITTIAFLVFCFRAVEAPYND
jgi:hypothetical protein